MIRLVLPISVLALSACQGPWRDIEFLSAQSLAPETEAVEVVAGSEGGDEITVAEIAAADQAVAEVEDEPRRGFLSVLKKLILEKSPEDLATEDALAAIEAEDAVTPDAAPEPEPVELAALRPEVADTPEGETTVSDAEMPGLFGFLRRSLDIKDDTPPKRTGPDADIVPGSVMAFGNIGRVCDVPESKLGEEIAGYPERRTAYRLYDTDPDSTRSRTLYLTGFADGCPRQVTGAMAMFGDAEMHEAIRYGAAASIQPPSDLDRAYDRIKRSVCNVGRKKPCGDKLQDLQRDTVFVSVYETFGAGGRWSNILLHDGEVAASEVASNTDL